MKLIAHIDLNAFFAQVEMNRHPELKDKPIVVGGPIGRSVVATSNYNARKFGIHSGMPVSEALSLCDDLVVIPGDYIEYSQKSIFFFDIVRKVFPIIEMASIDECYVDATEQCKEMNEEEIYDFFWDFQMTLLKASQLKCSIGVGHTKFMAKMGSDYKKPLGLTLLLNEQEIKAKILPLPISTMFGIGKKTAPKLEILGVKTIDDFLNCTSDDVNKLMGSRLDLLKQEIEGVGDDRIDMSEWNPTSQSCDTTFDFDTNDYEEIKSALIYCSEQVGLHLRKFSKVTKTIALKLRNAEFITKTKRMSLDHYTNTDEDISYLTLKIFDTFYNDEPLRLVGCCAENCIDSTRIPIQEKGRQMTIDEAIINNKKKGKKNEN